MMHETPNWPDPRAHIVAAYARYGDGVFLSGGIAGHGAPLPAGFDGLVTYAVKANAGEEVLTNLVAAGIRAFDVASPREMYAVRASAPTRCCIITIPVRSPEEIAVAVALGVTSYSVDCARELDKLSTVPARAEMSVRLALAGRRRRL